MHLNYPEPVHKHPAQIASPLKMLEKVRYSRTTPNSCERTLHTFLSLKLCGSSTTTPPSTSCLATVLDPAVERAVYYWSAV